MLNLALLNRSDGKSPVNVRLSSWIVLTGFIQSTTSSSPLSVWFSCKSSLIAKTLWQKKSHCASLPSWSKPSQWVFIYSLQLHTHTVTGSDTVCSCNHLPLQRAASLYCWWELVSIHDFLPLPRFAPVLHTNQTTCMQNLALSPRCSIVLARCFCLFWSRLCESWGWGEARTSERFWTMFRSSAPKPEVPSADKKPHHIRAEDKGAVSDARCITLSSLRYYSGTVVP